VSLHKLIDLLRDRVSKKPILRWVFVATAAMAIAAVVVSGVWTIRHAWAIYKLNRGVGDTVFYDADDKPWFRLDEQRQDVQADHIATFFKDAVIAVEDHRFYLHPGIDPIGLSRAVVNNVRGEDRQGAARSRSSSRELCFSPTRKPTAASSKKRCCR
jgi:membrane peptidoglycan carboxypeptidase